MKKKYELWEDEDGSLEFFASDNDAVRQGLSEVAKCIWEVEADSYNEAMAKRNEYLGWEPYVPIVESDEH